MSGRKLRAILQKAAPPALRVSQQRCSMGRGTRRSPQSGWQLPLHVRVPVAVTRGLATGRSPPRCAAWPPLQTTPGRGNLHIYLVPPCPKGGGAGTHPLIAAGKHPQPGPGLSVITRLPELSWLRTAGSSAPGAPGSSAINPQHQQRQLMPAWERSSGVPRDGGANSPGPPRDRGFS